ncbi:MAG: hypothetical protein ACK559_36290, partial [bacterium]
HGVAPAASGALVRGIRGDRRGECEQMIVRNGVKHAPSKCKCIDAAERGREDVVRVDRGHSVCRKPTTNSCDEQRASVKYTLRDERARGG